MNKFADLRNGIKVLRLPDQNSSVFTVGMVFATGYANEYQQFPAGVTELTRRVMWLGTDKHPSHNQLNRTLESIGGKFHSFVTEELMHFYITVPSKHAFRAVSLLAELVQRPLMDEDDINNHKKILAEQVKDFDPSNFSEASPLSLVNAYKGHNYEAYGIGDIEETMSVRRRHVVELMERQMVPEYGTLVLAGDFQVKDITPVINTEWSHWNPKPKPYREVLRLSLTDIKEALPNIAYHQRGIGVTHFACGFVLSEGAQPTIVRETSSKNLEQLDMKEIKSLLLTSWAKQSIISSMLGEGYSSKLWQKTVEEEQCLETVESRVVRFSRSSLLEVVGVAENTQFTFALENILQIIDNIKKSTSNINDVAMAKEKIKGQLMLNTETVLDQAIWNVSAMLTTGMDITIEDMLEVLDAVNANEVRDYAKDEFGLNSFYLTTYGTAKETAVVKKLISKYLV